MLSLEDYKSQSAMHPGLLSQGKWCSLIKLCFVGYVVPTLTSLWLSLNGEILFYILSLAQGW